MAELMSCPFCRELYAEDEGLVCPECDLALVPLYQLPLSLEGQAEAVQLSTNPPEDQNLPLTYLRRGRGVLSLCALLGLVLFVLPWVSLQRPDSIQLSGYDLARSSAPWLFGGAVGWFVLLPLVLSRRTVNQLRGIRVIAVFFCLLSAGEVAMMLGRPPAMHHYFSVGLSYLPALYASGILAIVAAAFASRLGGSLEDLRDLPLEVPPGGPVQGDPLH